MDSAFAVLRLEAVSDVVYVEGLMGYFFLQNQGDVVRYRRAFDQLRAVALSPSDSRDPDAIGRRDPARVTLTPSQREEHHAS